jgi:hypothetical protein
MMEKLLADYYGLIPTKKSPLFLPVIDRAIALENKVYLLMQMTQCPRELVIEIVQEGVLTFDDTMAFAEVYNRFPNVNESEEIYLMGFKDWNKLNLL